MLFRILFFAYADGCDQCEAAEPELTKFEKSVKDIQVIRIRATVFHSIGGTRITKTPTYLISENGRITHKHVGKLKATQLAKLFKGKGGA